MGYKRYTPKYDYGDPKYNFTTDEITPGNWAKINVYNTYGRGNLKNLHYTPWSYVFYNNKGKRNSIVSPDTVMKHYFALETAKMQANWDSFNTKWANSNVQGHEQWAEYEKLHKAQERTLAQWDLLTNNQLKYHYSLGKHGRYYIASDWDFQSTSELIRNTKTYLQQYQTWALKNQELRNKFLSDEKIAQEKEAERARLGNQARDEAYNNYLNKAGEAKDFVKAEMNKERSTSKLWGMDYSQAEKGAQGRVEDYFSTIWSKDDQTNLEDLIKEWGFPKDFDAFMKRGEGGTYDGYHANKSRFGDQGLKGRPSGGGGGGGEPTAPLGNASSSKGDLGGTKHTLLGGKDDLLGGKKKSILGG